MLVIWIGLAVWVNFHEFYKTNLPQSYPLLDQVQYSVMASRTSNQASWKVYR